MYATFLFDHFLCTRGVFVDSTFRLAVGFVAVPSPAWSSTSASTRYTVARLTPSVAAIVETGSPLVCILRASAALDLSSALGRPMAWPRARRASLAAARR